MGDLHRAHQWQPLWEDVARVAEAILRADGEDDAVARIAPHFLGAVLIKHVAVNGPATSSASG